MTVLVTGAAGFIGSHALVELLGSGRNVVGVDDYSRSSSESVRRAEDLAGRRLDAMCQLDLRDTAGLAEIFRRYGIESVIHLAGFKSVSESVQNPVEYFNVNVGGALSLLTAAKAHHVNQFVFSSSCTVYGDLPPDQMPLREDSVRVPVNPYGRTKLQIEEMFEALCESDASASVISLRYFNPIGAHQSGIIGEDTAARPTSLLPHVMQAALGQSDHVKVFGADYPTSDGTAVRDYVHIVDLARGHISALDRLHEPGFRAVNLGTGTGSSVLDVVKAASKVIGREIDYSIEPRRPGDAAVVYADPGAALELLGWKAEFNLEQMCADHWAWQKSNPHGYR